MQTQSRDNILDSLQRGEAWDLVIIGGGVTGAGIFRQAARSGYKTLLVEQQDYAWGTSSRSSKMVHGGFRYIAQGDIQLTREALHEREQMLKEVPGLVDRMQFIFPLRKGRFPGRFALGVLLKVYDLLAGVHDSSYINNQKLAEQVKGLDVANMNGAIGYSDASTDDARLVMRLIQEGNQSGGVAINYVKATSLIKDNKGKVTQVVLSCEHNQDCYEIDVSCVVNATGAWADQLMGLTAENKKIRPLRGSHLVLKAEKFPLNNALTLVHPDDGRPVFMFPWFGRILLGTTDLDYPENLDVEVAITEAEIDYLLKVVNDFFKEVKLERGDIISSFCGVRPVISSGKGIDPSKEKRGHSIWQDHNLISVSGGKLTIFRVIADEVMQKVSEVFNKPVIKLEKNIFNASVVTNDSFKASHIDNEYKKVLIGRYGELLNDFVHHYEVDAYELIEDYGFSLADCYWAVDMEQALHLDDLMFRRTRLGLLQDDENLLQTLARYMAMKLFWSEDDLHREIQRYKAIKNSYYSNCQE